MKLSQEIIDDIRNSSNIVEVIGHYLPLTKQGKSYRAVCPFHDDHDPSLSISEEKQIYKCFVCGNGGNVFSFVSNYKKISFVEAVEEVSVFIGKPITIDKQIKKVSKYQKYYDLLNAMITYCSYLLTASKMGKDALNYLESRGLEKEVIEYFNIGLNPEGNLIYKYLKDHQFNEQDMLDAGVCRYINNGYADIFYNRVIFPIHDYEGNPIAFSARDYIGNSEAKYINSNENIIYSKGDNLYNYHRAKDAIRKSSYVLLCEGVMDVIAYYRIGKENVLATLGTACTKKQLELLKRLNCKVVLSYDGDNAGKAANIKIGEQLLTLGIPVSVIDNNTGLDPDEIIKQFDKNTLRDLETKQISYIDYAIKYYRDRYNLNNYDDRKQMTIKISKLIDLLEDEYDRDNFYNELYDITKLKQVKTTNNKKVEYNRKVANYSFSIDGLTKAEYIVLSQIAMDKRALDIYQRNLGYLLEPNNQKLVLEIIDDYRKNNKCSLSRIYDQTSDEAIKNLITNMALLETLPNDFNEDSLNGAIDRIKLEIKRKNAENLKQKIADLPSLSSEKAQEYLREYEKVIRELGGNNEERN